VTELSEVTLEAVPSFLELNEQARRSQVCGNIFHCGAVLELRLKAIEWFTSQFAAFGYRDEWLEKAVNCMDRAAFAWSTSDATGSANPSSVEAREAAKQVMDCKELWLAAVRVALKMSEAEAELGISLRDLFLPLVTFWTGRLQGRPFEVAPDPCGRHKIGASPGAS
jgi:hypothetical protein